MNVITEDDIHDKEKKEIEVDVYCPNYGEAYLTLNVSLLHVNFHEDKKGGNWLDETVECYLNELNSLLDSKYPGNTVGLFGRSGKHLCIIGNYHIDMSNNTISVPDKSALGDKTEREYIRGVYEYFIDNAKLMYEQLCADAQRPYEYDEILESAISDIYGIRFISINDIDKHVEAIGGKINKAMCLLKHDYIKKSIDKD